MVLQLVCLGANFILPIPIKFLFFPSSINNIFSNYLQFIMFYFPHFISWKNFQYRDAEFFSKFKKLLCACVRRHQQQPVGDLAEQPTYSKCRTYIANICKNTLNIWTCPQSN